ncbi:MAG: D-alanyl-D-alanine carboxypeptidase [Flavisolibacter sp.]
MLQKVLLPFVVVFLLASCSPAAHIRKSAEANVLQSGALRNAHVGISVYDAESNQYLYNYQGDKYFVPASNTKLPTCYAAMKFLGDSLPGLLISDLGDSLLLTPTGDPTLLHADFSNQPVLTF